MINTALSQVELVFCGVFHIFAAKQQNPNINLLKNNN